MMRFLFVCFFLLGCAMPQEQISLRIGEKIIKKGISLRYLGQVESLPMLEINKIPVSFELEKEKVVNKVLRISVDKVSTTPAQGKGKTIEFVFTTNYGEIKDNLVQSTTKHYVLAQHDFYVTVLVKEGITAFIINGEEVGQLEAGKESILKTGTLKVLAVKDIMQPAQTETAIITLA